MKSGRSAIRRGAFLAAGVFALWLAVIAYARTLAPGGGCDSSAGSVDLTREEVRRLSLLHGTNVIKIERGTVSILRDGRWIPLPRPERG